MKSLLQGDRNSARPILTPKGKSQNCPWVGGGAGVHSGLSGGADHTDLETAPGFVNHIREAANSFVAMQRDGELHGLWRQAALGANPTSDTG